MENDKVVSLSGAPAVGLEPLESVIERAETLLEAARSGEVNGIAVVMAHQDGTFSYGASGLICSTGALGQLSILTHVIAQDILEDE